MVPRTRPACSAPSRLELSVRCQRSPAVACEVSARAPQHQTPQSPTLPAPRPLPYCCSVPMLKEAYVRRHIPCDFAPSPCLPLVRRLWMRPPHAIPFHLRTMRGNRRTVSLWIHWCHLIRSRCVRQLTCPRHKKEPIPMRIDGMPSSNRRLRVCLSRSRLTPIFDEIPPCILKNGGSPPVSLVDSD